MNIVLLPKFLPLVFHFFLKVYFIYASPARLQTFEGKDHIVCISETFLVSFM